MRNAVARCETQWRDASHNAQCKYNVHVSKKQTAKGYCDAKINRPCSTPRLNIIDSTTSTRPRQFGVVESRSNRRHDVVDSASSNERRQLNIVGSVRRQATTTMTKATTTRISRFFRTPRKRKVGRSKLEVWIWRPARPKLRF